MFEKCDIEFEISIHSLRMEGDVEKATVIRFSKNFNPLPPHGGRPANILHDLFPAGISIHSLRMEGDGFRAFP